MIGLIIKYLIITYALSDLAKFIADLLNNFKFNNKMIEIIKLLISYILICERCFALWFTIIATGNLLIAAIISISINYILQLEYKYKKTLL